MLDRVLGEHIKVQTVLDPEVGRFDADPGQVERALLNLALNAKEAMPRGGLLTLETRGIDSEMAREAWDVTLPEGRFCALLIRDDGEGIPAEDLPKVFEPFFSTKNRGEGSGLGLAMVDGIVNQSGGFLFIDSTVGVGTELRLCFPETRGEGEKGDAAPDGEAEDLPLLKGTETVLVVDDDPMMRKMTCALLDRAGYQTLSASGGPEALGVLETHAGAPIQLVITDVIMPKMMGDELAAQIRSERPGLPVLFMSGHSGRALDEVSKSDIPLVEKPFTAEALTRAVRRALEEPNGRKTD